MTKNSNSGSQQLGRRALRALGIVGGNNYVVIGIVLTLGLLTAIVFDASIEGIKMLIPETKAGEKVWWGYPLMVAVPLLIGLFIVRALKKRVDVLLEELEPMVNVECSSPVKVLIIFLSHPYSRAKTVEDLKGTVEAFLARPSDGNFLDTDWLKKNFIKDDNIPNFAPNWRMPFTAIKYHMDVKGACLKSVIVIPSADNRDILGTHHLDEIFCQYVETAAREQNLLLTVTRVADVLDGGKMTSESGPQIDLTKGIDFSDIKNLVRLLFRLRRELQKDFHESEVLIDVTGGQVPNSVAAAVFAILVPTRRFQYVDTNTYKVKSYDVSHELDTLMTETSKD